MNEVADWIARSAVPLATVEAGHGFADLERLRDIIGDARIVSLGEATHGTREFFQLKHRLVEFCVSELGFTMFGIEASFPESLRVNDYVLHGKGNPAEALAGMRFWTWDTEEVLTLVEWIRGWNRTHERKVKFYGFDMQFPAEAALGVIGYLGRVAPEFAAAAETELYPLCSDLSAAHFSLLPETARRAALGCITQILDRFESERTAWIAKTSKLEWQLARLHAVVLDQGTRRSLSDSIPSYGRRDIAMAENIASLLEMEGPETRAVLWAHNSHVAKRSPYFSEEKVPVANMGSCLDRRFGSAHFVVGFAFNRGAFQARASSGELVSHTVSTALEGSLDHMLALSGIPLFLLDLATVPGTGPVSDWLAAKPSSRWIGSMYAGERENEFQYACDPRGFYDMLAFVGSTTAAIANPSGRRPREPDSEPAAGPKNLGLTGPEEIPEGWSTPASWRHHAHTIAISNEPSPRGGRSIRIARTDAPWRWGEGQLVQTFSATSFCSKVLQLGAAVRAEVTEQGAAAQLYLRVLSKGQNAETKPVGFCMLDKPVRLQQWAVYTIEIKVPTEAYSITVGLALIGNGEAWFGDIALESR